MQTLSALVFIALLCHACPAQRASSSAPALPELDQARAAYDRGDTAAATRLFLAVLEKMPSSFEANETVGLIYAEQGAYARALPYLQAGVRAAPGQAVAHANLGAAMVQLGRNPEAVGELLLACSLNPSDAQARANLARAQLAAGDATAAAGSFSTAAGLGAAGTDLLYNWALALFDAGQPGTAAEVLARIPGGEATDQIESLYGDAEEKQGHYQAAAAHLQRAAQLTPSEPNVYALTVELLRHWSWEQAAEVARFGTQRYPASERLADALGIAQYGGGKYPEAAASFGALLTKSPHNSLYADLLGRSCESLDETSSASCDQMESFADRHPGNAQMDVYAARSILHRSEDHQDLPRARRFLEAALQADPKAADAYYELGVLEQQGRDWQASAASLERAVALRPAYAEAHYRLARAYYRLGKREKGDQEMELQRKYQQQGKEELDRKLKDVTIFLFKQP